MASTSLFLALGTATAFAAPSDFKTSFDTSAFSTSDQFQTGDASCSFASNCNSIYLGNGDPTPFYQQVVNINGSNYFHVIVGDPSTGFAEEYYTPYANGGGSTTALRGANNPFGAGMEMSVMAPSWTATAGHPTPAEDFNLLTSVGNAGNPLDSVHISGSGGGGPAHAVFHMILTSSTGDMSLDVNKPLLDKKPIISQTVQDGAMTSVFVVDMRKQSYGSMNDPAPVVNTLVIQDPSIPGSGAANFDMSKAEISYVTAGRFTFTPGAGWNNATGWDNAGSAFDYGTYDYFGGSGFDPFTADWTAFFNYDQNALACQRFLGVYARVDEGNGGVGSCPGHP